MLFIKTATNQRNNKVENKYKQMIDYDLTKIKAVVFDVDGVLSRQTVVLAADGEPLRTVNIKDGYAIQLAVKLGLRIVILTGGNTAAIEKRYASLGVEDIYMKASVKIKKYEELLKKYDLKNEEIVYVGDDIPDYEVMRHCGCPCCPKDACSDIKEISTYVSDREGGDGVGRDILEQILRSQGKWLSDEKAFGW